MCNITAKLANQGKDGVNVIVQHCNYVHSITKLGSRIIQLEFWNQEKEKCEEVQGTILLRGTVGLRGVSSCRTPCLFNGFTAFSAWLPARRRCDFVFSSSLFSRWWSLLFGLFSYVLGISFKVDAICNSNRTTRLTSRNVCLGSGRLGGKTRLRAEV